MAALAAAPYSGIPVKPEALSTFNTGLYSCCSNCNICCLGTFLPCALYADNYHRLHGQGFCFRCFLWCFCCWCLRSFFAATTRRTIRMKYAIQEQPFSDYCVHCWCPLCAICQEARELQSRGLPPAAATMPYPGMGGAMAYPQQFQMTASGIAPQPGAFGGPGYPLQPGAPGGPGLPPQAGMPAGLYPPQGGAAPGQGGFGAYPGMPGEQVGGVAYPQQGPTMPGQGGFGTYPNTGAAGSGFGAPYPPPR